MFIQSNPTGQVYLDLLDLAFEVCDEFMFIVRCTPSPINQNALKLIKELEPYLKWLSKENGWIGTLCSDYAMVHYYYTNDATKEIIKRYSSSLHEWRHPNLSEDLSFVKDNNTWLSNTSHEYTSCIYTTDKTEIARITSILGLEVRL